MSTPLFIQEVTAYPTGSGGGLILGVSLTSQPTWNSTNTVVGATTEQTLIESICYCAQAFSTDAGQLVVSIENLNGSVIPIGSYEIPAGTASQWASGEIRLDVPLPVGWKLYAAHNVQKSASYVYFAITAFGGIVR